jgi:YjbE family integral membrane protein
MLASITDHTFWISLGQIMLVNIILSGDNAVVIALAARSLPEKQQKKAVIWGSVAAISMRVILTIVALSLLKIAYLKIVGSFFLLWIAIKLISPETEQGHGKIAEQNTLAAAIRTILLADLVMSLDNVLAVAAAAKGNNLLLMLGLMVSIPLVIFGSTLILKVMERTPLIVTLGSALLGWVSGEMLVTDPALLDFFHNPSWSVYGEIIPLATAALVVGVGRWLNHKKSQLPQKPIVDLVNEDDQLKQ